LIMIVPIKISTHPLLQQARTPIRHLSVISTPVPYVLDPYSGSWWNRQQYKMN